VTRLRERVLHGLWFWVAAAALSGAARADGTGLLEKPSAESDQASAREFYGLVRRKLDPTRLPAEVTRTVLDAVPGLKVDEAHWLQHRPITWIRIRTEFGVKGRDADGHEVTVRMDEDGSHPTVTRVASFQTVPEAVLAEARPYALKNGYRLTSALVVTRQERFLVRASTHTMYYLKGDHPDRPGVEKFVWLSGTGRFGLRDLDDLMWKTVLTE
jgi:hypothetical protein